MTPEVITALVNLGSAGAVIIVVMIFQKSIKERDQEWRDFFTALSGNSQSRIDRMNEVTQKIQDGLEALLRSYEGHDIQAKEIRSMMLEVKDLLSKLKQPAVSNKGSSRGAG